MTKSTTTRRRFAAALFATGVALLGVGVLADTANADPVGANALVTHYDSAPGHGPSLSAVCLDADSIRIGSHPWDLSHRNFQLWTGTTLVANVTTGDAQYWTVPVGHHTLRYAGKTYLVDGDRCAAATPTTEATVVTTTPAPPTVAPPTTTEAPPTTSTPPAPPTTLTTMVVDDIPEQLLSVASVPTGPQLPHTGPTSATPYIIAAGLLLVLVGGGVVLVAPTFART